MRGEPKGELAADLTALFAAWAMGHMEARGQIADLLAEEGRGTLAAQVRQGRDAVEALLLVIG